MTYVTYTLALMNCTCTRPLSPCSPFQTLLPHLTLACHSFKDREYAQKHQRTWPCQPPCSPPWNHLPLVLSYLSNLVKLVDIIPLTSLARALAKENSPTPWTWHDHRAQTMPVHALDAPVRRPFPSMLATPCPLFSPTGSPWPQQPQRQAHWLAGAL
jgi:hypothetical protein